MDPPSTKTLGGVRNAGNPSPEEEHQAPSQTFYMWMYGRKWKMLVEGEQTHPRHNQGGENGKGIEWTGKSRWLLVVYMVVCESVG